MSVWLGSSDTKLLESGVVTKKNQRGKSLQKDREMGETPKATDGTLRPMTKQIVMWNSEWWQPIFTYLEHKDTDMENVVESAIEIRLLTQLNSYKGGSVLKTLGG